jgi:hypothetical protein
MDEAATRLILLGAFVLAALVVAGAGHLRRFLRGRAATAGPLDLTGVEGRVVFFSDAACPTCDAARARLRASRVPFREIGYHEDPAAHRRAGVTAVPLTVVRGSDGGEVGRIGGRPSRRALRRLLGRAGVK